MKFLAFLKDSYREAVSGWVLQVMLGLMALFIAVVASTSFDRVGLKEDLAPKIEAEAFAGIFTGADTGNARFALENFRQTNDGEPWQGNYEFDMVIRCNTLRELDVARNNTAMPTSRRRLERWITTKDVAPYLTNVTVGEGVVEDAESRRRGGAAAPEKPGEAAGDPNAPKTLRFRVVTAGTTIDNRLAWPHSGHIFFGALELPGIMSLREWVFNLQTTLMNDIGAWIIVLMGVVATAGFIPNLMRKGSVDLIISKPVSRYSLLLLKYLGGLCFVVLLVTFAAVGTWLIIGVRFNFWSPNFLVVIPVISFYFAVLYSISVLMGVLTRTAVVAILVTVIAWGIITLAGWGSRVYQETTERYQEIKTQLEKVNSGKSGDDELLPTEAILAQAKPSTYTTAAYYAYSGMPKTYDLDKRATRIIGQGILTDLEQKKRGYDKEYRTSWAQIVVLCLAHISAMLGLSYWRFSTRDG